MFFGCGWLLVPRAMVPGPKLLRLGCILASGMAFVACVTATVCCKRPLYLTLVPVVQIAAAVLAVKRRASVEPAPEAWTSKEVILTVAIVVAGTLLFQAPYDVRLPGGGIREPNPDLGYYAQLVMTLPEAGAANSWAAVLGSDAVAASGVRDQWYHWGAMYLAVAVRAVIALPPVDALLRVVCPALSVLLIVGAAAAAGAVCRRLAVMEQMLLGLASLVCVQWLRTPETMQFVKSLTAGEFVPHMRYPLGTALAYKYEGVLGLASMGLWLQGRWRAAAMMLFLAALAAPHIVASVGVGAAPLLMLGLVLRRKSLWLPAAVMLACLLGAWCAIALTGGAFPRGSGNALLKLDTAAIAGVASGFGKDLFLTMVLGALTLPGILHLIRAKEPGTEPLNLIGWLALLAGVGASGALQLMKNNPDRFHVMTLAQALIVMPVSLWGLVRMVTLREGGLRWIALVLALVSVAMGVDTMFSYRKIDTVAPWTADDLATLREKLQGRPFGYMTMTDRGWWISKHGFLASLLGSRCARVNPLPGSHEHSAFYGETAPFRSLPPLEKESMPAWCVRFMAARGIHHLAETADDPLPPPLKSQCQKLAQAGGITLYELPVTLKVPQ